MIPEESDVEDDFADEESDFEDTEDDNCGDTTEATHAEPGEDIDDYERSAHEFNNETFDIVNTVNLKSADLIDILADKDSVPAKPAASRPTSARIISATKEKVLEEADWDM